MRVTFYYVRHGQTLFNVRGRIQGSCDSPLTKLGIEEAEKARDALKNVHFDRAYTSSSERASDTAAIVLQGHGLSAVPLKGLKEFDFGTLDGELLDHIRDEIDRRKKDNYHFSDIGGDDLQTISDRIRKTFDSILKQCSDGDKVLIVSHGAYCGHLVRTLMEIDPAALKERTGRKKGLLIPNAGIMKFAYDDGQWILEEGPCEAEDFHDADRAIAK